jgi:cellulose biosynthesis protein BcsQ
MSETKRRKVLTVYVSKGGVGKSTLIWLLGLFLAGRGFRVVIVDLDIQGSQSTIFDLVDELGRGREVLHLVLKRQLDVLAALTPISPTLLPSFDSIAPGELFVIQGGPQTKEAIDEIASNPVRFRMANTLDIVREPIQALGDFADYVLMDMGPSDQVSALAGLTATDWLLIPTTMDFLSVERIAPVLDEVEVARQVQALDIVGIVPMMTNYYFGGLRKSQTVQAGEKYLEANYSALVLKDSAGLVDLPYHEDIRKVMWAGQSLLSAEVSQAAKHDALRLLNAVGKTIGLEAVKT